MTNVSFTEGNGRSIKEFIREISIIKSKEIGLNEMELNWKLIDQDTLNKDLAVAHLFFGHISIAFYNALTEKSQINKTKA